MDYAGGDSLDTATERMTEEREAVHKHPERDRHITEAVLEGASARQVAAQYGLSVATIRYLVAKACLERNQQQYRALFSGVRFSIPVARQHKEAFTKREE